MDQTGENQISVQAGIGIRDKDTWYDEAHDPNFDRDNPGIDHR